MVKCSPVNALGRILGAATLLAGVVGTALGAADDPFPEPRPTTRAEAVRFVAGPGAPPLPSLTPKLRELHRVSLNSVAVRRALALLTGTEGAGTERTRMEADGVRVRYSPAETDPERLAETDDDEVPPVVPATLDAIRQARALLVQQMQLPGPESVEIVLRDLGGSSLGYLVPDAGSEGGATIVLEAAPRGGMAAARRAAAHQYASAVALAVNPSFRADWAEAFAVWTVLALGMTPDPATNELLSRRLERLGAGLLSRDPELIGGNALWLAFLEQLHGRLAVRVTIEELGRGGDPAEALDRALERAAGEDLAAAFREFHLWALLVGPRADRHHFPFAGRLRAPRLASQAVGLPALSVRSDPAVASWGAAHVRLEPRSQRGGLRLHFEGEFAADWDADLLLVGRDGTRRRVPLEISNEGRGGMTVPLQGLAEVFLLVRNLGSDDDLPHRYTYAAHREPGYPFEVGALDATPASDATGGVLVAWETLSEQELLGFDVLRSRSENGPATRVNPVWVPALGAPDAPTSYHVLDRTAEPGVAYFYRVEGITRHGLTTVSESVPLRSTDLVD